MIDDLDQIEVWSQFREKKCGSLTRRELAALDSFLEARRYTRVVEGIRQGAGFESPTKKLVNKLGSSKKRVVYCFDSDETWVLKLVAHLLYRYDRFQPEGCYSFRRGFGAHRAIRKLTTYDGISQMWSYKVDVRDYFNSIHIPTLLPILESVVGEDQQLFAFLTRMLTSDKARYDGTLIVESRGVMAGVPIAPFLANLYLGALDQQFAQIRPYARYSDDIILFASTEAELGDCHRQIGEILTQHHLQINPDKEQISAPGEPWEFLGIAYDRGHVDLSLTTQRKLKGKIRRKARALRRWMLRKDATPERAMKAMIRSFNRKFYSRDVSSSDLTWSRWFFPLLTRDDGLRKMDTYLQQEIRFIPSGHHRRANYRLTYASLKAMGYRSLVHEYWKDRRESAPTPVPDENSRIG